MATTESRSAHRRTNRLTDEERVERVERLNAQLGGAVATLTTSEGWLSMLRTAAKFPRYSWRNQLLLAVQAEHRGVTLSRVASFGRWHQLGYGIKRGSKGFEVFAPIKRRLTVEEAYEVEANGGRGFNEDGCPVMAVRGFKIEHVFDLHQLEPRDDAEPLELERSWISQHGQGPEGLWQVLCQLIEAEGYRIDLRCPTPADGGAHGSTSRESRIVWIRSDVDEAERIRVAAHELGHIRADHFGRHVPRSQEETEADGIAYIVCHVAGLDIGDSSTSYIAGWAGTGEQQREVLTAAAEAVHAAAMSILAELESAEMATPFEGADSEHLR
jgi:hypothetical protein